MDEPPSSPEQGELFPDPLLGSGLDGLPDQLVGFRAHRVPGRRHHLPAARLLGPHRPGGPLDPRRRRFGLAAPLLLQGHARPEGREAPARRRGLAAEHPGGRRVPAPPRRPRPRRVTLFSDGTTVYECCSPEEVVDLLQGGQGVFGIAVSGAMREISGSIKDFPVERADGGTVERAPREDELSRRSGAAARSASATRSAVARSAGGSVVRLEHVGRPATAAVTSAPAVPARHEGEGRAGRVEQHAAAEGYGEPGGHTESAPVRRLREDHPAGGPGTRRCSSVLLATSIAAMPEAAHGLQRERDGHRPGQSGQQVADARHREAHDEQHGHRQPRPPRGPAARTRRAGRCRPRPAGAPPRTRPAPQRRRCPARPGRRRRSRSPRRRRSSRGG